MRSSARVGTYAYTRTCEGGPGGGSECPIYCLSCSLDVLPCHGPLEVSDGTHAAEGAWGLGLRCCPCTGQEVAPENRPPLTHPSPSRSVGVLGPSPNGPYATDFLQREGRGLRRRYLCSLLLRASPDPPPRSSLRAEVRLPPGVRAEEGALFGGVPKLSPSPLQDSWGDTTPF